MRPSHDGDGDGQLLVVVRHPLRGSAQFYIDGHIPTRFEKRCSTFFCKLNFPTTQISILKTTLKLF